MKSTKFSASELSKKLDQKRKSAREEARRKKLEEETLHNEIVRINEKLEIIKAYLDTLIQQIAYTALPLALEGIREMGIDDDIYENCGELLESLGFDLDLKDIETLSIISLSKKLKSLNQEEIKVLEQKLRLNLSKFNEISTSEYGLNAQLVRFNKVENSIIFCEKYLLYMKNILERYDENEWVDSDIDLFKLDKIIRHIKPSLDKFVMYGQEEEEYLQTLKWTKNTKSVLDDYWFNASNLY